MTKKKKEFDPFDLVTENTQLSAGLMIGTGITARLGEIIPSDSSENILAGMQPLSMLPTIHATGGVFSAMDDMSKRFKRHKK